MDHASHTDQLPRLRRIQGQINGLVSMVEQERYCVDLLTQVRAARAALKRVEEGILRAHVEHCVADALQSRSPARVRAKAEELVRVFGRYSD